MNESCVLQCVACIRVCSCQEMYKFVAVCCSVLQCVAVCCSVLQCVAVCCGHSCLQLSRNVSVWCSLLQSVAVWCSLVQCVAVQCSMVQDVAVLCNVLHFVAVCCSVLRAFVPVVVKKCRSVVRCVAVFSSALQCAAGCFSVL